MPRTTYTLSISVPTDVLVAIASHQARSPFPVSKSAVAVAALRLGLAALEEAPTASTVRPDVEPWDGSSKPTRPQVELYARTVGGSHDPGYEPELEAMAVEMGLRV